MTFASSNTDSLVTACFPTKDLNLKIGNFESTKNLTLS